MKKAGIRTLVSWNQVPLQDHHDHRAKCIGKKFLLGRLAIPPPEGAVVADADDAVAVAADAGLPDGRRALRVAQDVEAAKIRVRRADVPDVCLAHLKTELQLCRYISKGLIERP